MNTFNVSFNDKVHQDQFASVLAHEVRNPLANIGLSVDTLLTMVKEERITVYLDIIKRNTVRINTLIKQLLTDKYITAKDTQGYDVNNLLDEVLMHVEDRIKLKGISVEKHYEVQQCIIFLNVPRMKIALTNIVINAVESMEQGKGILTLVTKTVYGKCVIEIKDNGCGISKKNLDRMFKESFTDKPGGLGLGLTIIYDILKLNHVAINVESDEGKGTNFSLLFDKNNQSDVNYKTGPGVAAIY